MFIVSDIFVRDLTLKREILMMKKKTFMAVLLGTIFTLSPVSVLAQSNAPQISSWEQELLERDRMLIVDPVNNALLAQREVELAALERQQTQQALMRN